MTREELKKVLHTILPNHLFTFENHFSNNNLLAHTSNLTELNTYLNDNKITLIGVGLKPEYQKENCIGLMFETQNFVKFWFHISFISIACWYERLLKENYFESGAADFFEGGRRRKKMPKYKKCLCIKYRGEWREVVHYNAHRNECQFVK